MRVGDIFARLFNVPLAILSVESYRGGTDGGKKDERGSVIFSRDLAKTTPNIGSKVLLVDDLADSGITLKKSVDWLQHIYGFYLDEPIRTGVIYYKSVSNFKPGVESVIIRYRGLGLILPRKSWIQHPPSWI